MADGQLGAQAARELTEHLRYRQCDVLFDHGDTTKDPARYVGNISSWFGKTYSTGSQLALLDIAVVDRSDDRAMVLVEIEETSSNPKTVIGDAFGTILGDHITFQGVRHLPVGDYTALLILLRNDPEKNAKKLRFLQDQISTLGAAAQTGNASLSRIELGFFQELDDLIERLFDFVDPWLAAHIEAKWQPNL